LVPSGCEGKGRLSSPLILTAYPIKEGSSEEADYYVPAALVMKNRKHVDNLIVSLADGGGNVIKSPDGKEKNWQAVQRNKDGTDALTAFMNFFARGGR
jgi:hypothetical protein